MSTAPPSWPKVSLQSLPLPGLALDCFTTGANGQQSLQDLDLRRALRCSSSAERRRRAMCTMVHIATIATRRFSVPIQKGTIVAGDEKIPPPCRRPKRRNDRHLPDAARDRGDPHEDHFDEPVCDAIGRHQVEGDCARKTDHVKHESPARRIELVRNLGMFTISRR